ncbi:GNAT family N-acetyltransferase [Mongoliitalea lutea]|uniref:N-acetyltransferase n=1 Tax=Mongoliitalea lutea TaxID=849756 RepID=A0A8J3CSI9_9BACT|nr:GNAT family N-acetyltransferase [Mongoliitalea lutea]GHB23647.1 N-acetyltransferase [Mongoliitalea lutea]
MIEIRLATSSDIPEIQKIALETWPLTFGEILSKEQITYMLDWMYSTEMLENQMQYEGHIFLLAFDSDLKIFIGFAGIQHAAKDQKTKIHKLYIKAGQQGKGVGKKLVEHIQILATKINDQALFLNVNKYNEQAIKFYQYIGFIEVAQEVIDIGRGFVMDDYIMEKPL